MLVHRAFAVLAAAALILSSACGDGPAEPAFTGDRLRSLEIDFVAISLVEFFLFNVDLYEPLPGPSAVPYGELFDEEIDLHFICGAWAPSGAVSVQGIITGDVNEVTGAVLLDIEAEADFEQCEYAMADWIRLTSIPTMTYHAVYDLESSEVQAVDLDASGDIRFEHSDGRTGTCVFDLNYGHVRGPAPVRATVSGQGCGFPVDYVF